MCMVNQQRSNVTSTGAYRRNVMKLIGAGSAVGVFGGVASGDEHEDEEDEGIDDDEADDTEDDASMDGTVHVVRTLIGQSTNPARPADFFYQPTGLHVEPGDVIRFVFETPDHNVTAYHPAFGMQRRVPSGVGPFSSPIMGWDPDSLPDDADEPPAENEEPAGTDAESDGGMDGEAGPEPSTWLRGFETPGVYDLECAPHEGFGMAMRVVVGDETETAFETSDPEELPPPRAGPVGLARGVLTDPNLEPDVIVDEGSVEWMDLEMNREAGNGAEEGDDGESDDSEGTDDDGANGDDDTNDDDGDNDDVE